MNKPGKIAIRLITFVIGFASGVVFIGLILRGLIYFAQS